MSTSQRLLCLLGFGALSATLLLAATAATHADPLALAVSNHSTMPLDSVQISPDYSTRWGGNRLNGVVGPGQNRVISLPDTGHDCFFDVQIGDAAGQVFQYWSVNLCTGSNIDHR
jgi:hypothetical protein